MIRRGIVSCLGVLLLSGVARAQKLTPTAKPVTSAQVCKQFAEPPRQYSSAPLWTWNDMLTEQQIAETMADLAGQKVRQVFVHPRPGLMTPYLSEDWFRLWKVALREAERLDMNVWIYDENSYPSGFAGGLVSEEVRQDVRKNVEALKPGGGYIFNSVHNTQAGVPPENIVAMFDAAREFGAY